MQVLKELLKVVFFLKFFLKVKRWFVVVVWVFFLQKNEKDLN